MSNHLVFKSFFVGAIRWPWKFVFNPNIGADGMWFAYSGTDNGVGDGIRRGWDLQCEYSGYEDLKLCIKVAEDVANNAALEIEERKSGAQ